MHDSEKDVMPTKTPRILHILDHSLPLHSGYVFRTMNLVREQRVVGWTTFHLTTPRQNIIDSPSEEVDGYLFFRTPAIAMWLQKLPIVAEIAQMAATRKRVLEVIDEVGPNLVHAHSPILTALPALSACRKRGLPLVYEIRAFWEDASVDHGTTKEGSLRYRLTRAIETYVIKRANAVMTICCGLYDDIIARGIPSAKVTVIPNAVDIERFPPIETYPSDLAEELELKGKKVIGFIGSFYAYEGLDLLIETLPKLIERDKDIVLLLVGGGPCESELRSQTDKLGVAGHVRFTGRVPHNVVDSYYALIDILAFPRHRMRLTDIVTPLKPLEAMAQKRIVVASDVGGHKELIKDKKTGFLFEAEDSESLAEVLIQVLDGDFDLESIKCAGRAFVEDERNWARSVANYREPYARLLGNSAQNL